VRGIASPHTPPTARLRKVFLRSSYPYMALILILGILTYLAPFYFEGSPLDPNGGFSAWAMISFVFAVLIGLAIFAEFEGFATSAKQIAVIAMLGTVSGLARIPFAALMNFQPSSFFIIVSGYVFGPMAGMMVGALTVLISNMFLGHGPWSAYQLFTWGLMGSIAGFLGKVRMPSRRERKILLMAYGVLVGPLYAFIIDTWYWATTLYPHTFDTWKYALYTAAFWTLSHSAANVFFLGILGDRVIAIMERFRERFFWSYEEPENTD